VIRSVEAHGSSVVEQLDIAYDRASLIINGRREFIRSGAMHYFRLPGRDLWRDRLFKLKAAGYNTVDLYFNWGYHSPAPGEYDFTGIRDVAALLEIVRELGLYVIARPGPYINAEVSGGGFPGWLLAKKHLPLRHRREGAFEWSDEYMDHVREWWGQIIPRINAAPNLILLQIENEYATLEMEPDYIRELYAMTREPGVKVPLFHNDLYVAGLYEDIVDLYAFDNYSVTQFETDWRHMPEVFQVLDHIEANLRPFCQNRPLMAAELQAGWFGGWKGYKYEKITELLGREHIAISTKSLLGQGLTLFNHYKAIGGTNWDYLGSIETYTSYDFGAPISEAGINTERLFESKAINQFLGSFDLTDTERLAAFPAALSHEDCLYAVRCPNGEPSAAWLFLRNLTDAPRSLTVDGVYTVTLKPFEVQILPWRIRLRSGCELVFSTAEPLYQNERWLVLKADRSVTLRLHAEATDLAVSGPDADNVDILESTPDSTRLHCPELPEYAFRHIRVGALNVLFLGAKLVDTFWVEEDGALAFGPAMRLPDGYALAEGCRSWWRILAQADTVESQPLEHPAEIESPVPGQWEITDDAPELWINSPASDAFHPVSLESPDFDANELYESCAWYRLPLDFSINETRPRHIELDARHIWAVFLNGRLVGQGHHLIVIHGLEEPPPASLTIPETLWQQEGDNELLIFVTGLGHPKGFHDDAQTPQGLLSLKVDGQDMSRSVQIAKDVYSRRKGKDYISETALMDFERSPIVRMKTTFSLPHTPQAVVPWGACLEETDFERIDLMLNGTLIGRYWRECRGQEMFYLPEGLLHTGPGNQNTLELILMNFQPFIEKAQLLRSPQPVTLRPYGVFNRVGP
jgi:hypothetical protein